jgi:choline dehydrogenase-like flavoprotein
MVLKIQVDVAIIGAGIVGTFVAKQLIRSGKTVALVDRGASLLTEQQPAVPPIEFGAGRHKGAVDARNHVLGGNGHYWGGGLVRPQSTTLGDVLGLVNPEDELLAADLGHNFRAAEMDSGVPFALHWQKFITQNRSIGSCSLAHFFLLTGKARNISIGALTELRKSSRCKIFANAEVLSFIRSEENKISGVCVAQAAELINITCSEVILSAGTIDTLLMLRKHAESFGLSESHNIGENLHDHIAVPIAKVGNLTNECFRDLMFPLFRDKGFSMRQLALLQDAGEPSSGLLRLIPMLDEASPYKELKEIFALRQKGLSPFLIAKSAVASVPKLPLLARIGYERYVNKRLYIGKFLPIQALLVFETAYNPKNRTRMITDERASINWRLNSTDELAFERLLDRAYKLLDELTSTFGIKVERNTKLNTSLKRRSFLHQESMDAFHLGGGIPYGRVIDHRLRLTTTQNVSIVSTAVLQRPGLPNPTLTLLALAHRCAEEIVGTNRS